MSLRRFGGVAVATLAALLELGCGDVYRPVVLPVTTTPATPASFHEIFSVNSNLAFNQGTAMQIDVSGGSNVGSAAMGVNPVHGAILPNFTRVFVAASAGASCPPGTDIVTSFTPAFDSQGQTGLGPPQIYSYPNSNISQSATVSTISEAGNTVTLTVTPAVTNAQVGTPIEISNVGSPGASPYNGCYIITGVSGGGTTITLTNPTSGLSALSGGTATIPSYCPYLPDFVATSQNTEVYVANFGVETGLNCGLASTDSVAQISPLQNVIPNLKYLPAGSHPVAMIETQDGLNLYVLNQGSGSVAPNITDLSPIDLSLLTTISLPAGSTNPIWAGLRSDGKRLYVVTESDGVLHTIRTDTNTIIGNQSVGGPGANFVLFDAERNRVYVTNPGTGAAAGSVYVFDATTDPPTPIGSPTGQLSIAPPPLCTANPGACGPVMPSSIAPLPDGSRFYVASYAVAGTCPDPQMTASNCVIPQITVFDAPTLTVKTTIFPLFTQLLSSTATTPPSAVAPFSFCAPVTPYAPMTAARFRMSAAAALDSSNVYVSVCDAGLVAIVTATTSPNSTAQNNTPDVLQGNLPTPFSAVTVPPGSPPGTQYPVFLFVGQ